MTYASDQDAAQRQLSETSQRMLALRDPVFDEWVRAVRKRVPEAGRMQHPILIDTLPAFYDNIAQAITPNYPRQTGAESNSLSIQHGSERARMTEYSHQALVIEYQLFRSAIFSVFQRENLSLNHDEFMTINASIDAGISQAVNGFIAVHSALRERFAAALTHDMRTPLSVAVTALELSLVARDPEKAQSMINRAVMSLRRMDLMIQQLLHSMACAGGHVLKLQHEYFDALDLAKEIQADSAPLHGPRIIVSGQSVCGWWGRSELKRALENIVNNAFKYGSADTAVTIMVKHVYERLLLSVRNEGPPIPAEEQECIFEMYRRAPRTVSAGGRRMGYRPAVCPCSS